MGEHRWQQQKFIYVHQKKKKFIYLFIIISLVGCFLSLAEFEREREQGTRESGVHVGEEGAAWGGLSNFHQKRKRKSVEEKTSPPPHHAKTHVDQHVLPGDTWTHTPRARAPPPSVTRGPRTGPPPSSHNRACHLVPRSPDTPLRTIIWTPLMPFRTPLPTFPFDRAC